MSEMKRIAVFENGRRDGGQAIGVPETMDELRQSIKARFGFSGEWSLVRLYTAQGEEVQDIALLCDADVLYAACLQPFIDPRQVAETPDTRSCAAPDLVTLNVGGRLFTTTRSTLTRYPDSKFGRMFADSDDPEKTVAIDPSGAYFFDRNPDHFGPLLHFLRHGLLLHGADPNRVLEEALYYGLTSLVDTMQAKIADPVVVDVTRRDIVLRLLKTPVNARNASQRLCFKGLHLDNIDFSGLDFSFSNFKNCLLRGANFSNADLSQCDFEGANLTAAVLSNAHLFDVRFNSANLTDANLTNTSPLNMAYLGTCRMEGTRFTRNYLKDDQCQDLVERGAIIEG